MSAEVTDCIACLYRPTHWYEDEDGVEGLCDAHQRELEEVLKDAEERIAAMVADGVHEQVATRILIVELEAVGAHR